MEKGLLIILTSDTGTNAVRKIYYSKRTAGNETMLTSDTKNVQKIINRDSNYSKLAAEKAKTSVHEKLPTVPKTPNKFQRVPY